MIFYYSKAKNKKTSPREEDYKNTDSPASVDTHTPIRFNGDYPLKVVEKHYGVGNTKKTQLRQNDKQLRAIKVPQYPAKLAIESWGNSKTLSATMQILFIFTQMDKEYYC